MLLPALLLSLLLTPLTHALTITSPHPNTTLNLSSPVIHITWDWNATDPARIFFALGAPSYLFNEFISDALSPLNGSYSWNASDTAHSLASSHIKLYRGDPLEIRAFWASDTTEGNLDVVGRLNFTGYSGPVSSGVYVQKGEGGTVAVGRLAWVGLTVVVAVGAWLV